MYIYIYMCVCVCVFVCVCVIAAGGTHGGEAASASLCIHTLY